jgi:hypothetical protein
MLAAAAASAADGSAPLGSDGGENGARVLPPLGVRRGGGDTGGEAALAVPPLAAADALRAAAAVGDVIAAPCGDDGDPDAEGGDPSARCGGEAALDARRRISTALDAYHPCSVLPSLVAVLCCVAAVGQGAGCQGRAGEQGDGGQAPTSPL